MFNDLRGDESVLESVRADAKKSVSNTNLFLMWNMGSSGGSWFEKVCNIHPDVGAWEEPIRQIITPNSEEWYERKHWDEDQLRTMSEKTLELFKSFEMSGKWKSIGFVKGFIPYVHEYCLHKNAVIVQMFRNPIKVVSAKFEKKIIPTGKWMKKHWGEDLDITNKKRWFECHVARYASFYQGFIDKQNENMLIRLEDLNESLRGDYSYFKKTMEHITQVEWDQKFISEVKQLKPYKEKKRSAYKIENSDKALWLQWEKWQVKVFKKYFAHIMEDQKYDFLGL